MKYLMVLMLVLGTQLATATTEVTQYNFGGSLQWADDSEIVEMMMEEIMKVELEIEEELASLHGDISVDYDPYDVPTAEYELSASAIEAHISNGTSNRLQNSSLEVSAHKDASTGSKYAWGQARNGFGYCYKWTKDGRVLNQGQPVANKLCEAVDPSYYSWATARNGHTYCYQYTSDHVALNEGQPVADGFCEE
jgi:hypothetical protein